MDACYSTMLQAIKKIGVLTLIAGTFLATLQAGAAHLTGSDKSVSQLIRSNPLHYWGAMKTAPYQRLLGDFKKYEGIVTGDPHFGNFSVIPLIDNQGHENLQFSDIDFDDAGKASFAFDFVRLVTTCKAIEWDLKSEDKFANVRDMVQAYIDGLNGRTLPTPPIIQAEIDKGIDRYHDKLDKLVGGKLDKHDSNKLALVDGEIISLSKRLEDTKNQIPALFPHMRVLDVVRVLKDRGGSAGAIRLWVLLKDENNRKRLFELKQWEETGLTAYEQQKPLLQWVRDLYPVFWPGQSDESYKIVQLDGTYYWKREKKKTLLDVPYKVDKDSDLDYLQNLAPFVANTLGQIHGRQASATAYKNLLNDPRQKELFRDAVKSAYKQYLQLAIDTIP